MRDIEIENEIADEERRKQKFREFVESALKSLPDFPGIPRERMIDGFVMAFERSVQQALSLYGDNKVSYRELARRAVVDRCFELDKVLQEDELDSLYARLDKALEHICYMSEDMSDVPEGMLKGEFEDPRKKPIGGTSRR